MKILFLYSEVAAYFLACAEALHLEYGCEVHIVRWPINPEAPFQFREYQGVTFYERDQLNDHDLIELYKTIQPELVYVSGWMDKGYLKAAKVIKQSNVPVVCGLDNHWRGDIRQKVATWISPFFLKNKFTHAFVPGIYQYEFARRLGFAPNQILTGMYSADLKLFDSVYHNSSLSKKESYPHNFLYVGRLIELKGIEELYQAFQKLTDEKKHDWTLTLVGSGNLTEKWTENPKVTIKDFVQPDELATLAVDAGCFILPSRNEPWGVVLHEFAGAGLPLVASNTVGSRSAFLKEGYNGYTHQAGNINSLKDALGKIVDTSDKKLLEMSQRSNELSRQITPTIWAATLLGIINKS